jgi:hypothetical protein
MTKVLVEWGLEDELKRCRACWKTTFMRGASLLSAHHQSLTPSFPDSGERGKKTCSRKQEDGFYSFQCVAFKLCYSRLTWESVRRVVSNLLPPSPVGGRSDHLMHQ